MRMLATTLRALSFTFSAPSIVAAVWAKPRLYPADQALPATTVWNLNNRGHKHRNDEIKEHFVFARMIGNE